MAKGKGPLAGVWLVGAVRWDTPNMPDVDTAMVARTKTAARRHAEAKIALAEVKWAENREAADRQRERDFPRHGLDRDGYADWAETQRGVATVPWRWYRTVRDGITLYGPCGEIVHIATASKAARRRACRNARESEAMIAGMIGAMRKGLAN